MIVYLALGVLLRHWGVLSDLGAKRITKFVVNAALPAMAFTGLRSVAFDPSMLVPISMPWILFGSAVGLFSWLASRYGWSRERAGALVLTAGLANTSFLGFPILEALLGRESLPIAALADQFGSFLALATVATFLAARWSGRAYSVRSALARLAIYPPFVAVVAALVLRDVALPDWVIVPLTWLAKTLAPLALVAVGLALRFRGIHWRGIAIPVTVGLAFKLVMAPLMMTGIYFGLLRQVGLVAHVTVLESAMAPMVMGSVLALDSGFDRDVTGTMLVVGIPLSLATVPLWDLILRAMV